MTISAGALLAVIALIFTLMAGLAWANMPIWIPLLLLCIAVMISGVPIWKR